MRMWEDNIKMSVWLRFVWLAQDKDKCPAVVNTVMDILFHKMRGFSLPSEELLASQERFCCMELFNWGIIF